MTTEKITFVRKLFSDYRRTSGRDPQSGHSLIVDVAGAQLMLQEVFFKLPPGIALSSDDDELFSIDGIPVRLRFELPFGSAFIVTNTNVPLRRCCDATAMSTMLVCVSRGRYA